MGHNFRPSKTTVFGLYFGQSKISIVGCNLGPLKITVVGRNFGPSKICIGGRNYEPSKLTIVVCIFNFFFGCDVGQLGVVGIGPYHQGAGRIH